jgi:sugar phosphate isomerase/epimerase
MVRRTMAVHIPGPTHAALPALDAVGADLRLGIDQPRDCWPTAPRLKSYEAAGFTHVQVRMPPRGLLVDATMVATHAQALRDVLDLTGLRLVLHAPDDLLAGDHEHDLQLDGVLTYAALAGCDLVVYHGARVPLRGDGAAVRARLHDEECSLRRLLPRAERLEVRLAIENLAPLYLAAAESVSAQPKFEHACHDPAAVASLVRRLGSASAGMCLDLGHAHIAADLAGCELEELVEPVLDQVILFHLHDNFGAGAAGGRSGACEPLRLDLHLPPGAGSVPWDRLAPLLAAHPAPLQLEVHPPARPEPGTLAVVVRELLCVGRGHAGAGRSG